MLLYLLLFTNLKGISPTYITNLFTLLYLLYLYLYIYVINLFTFTF